MTKLRTRYTQRYPTAPGVVLNMPFFEGSGLAPLDLSGKGNHGTITGATWTKDEKGPCLSFDGSDDWLNCGTDSSIAFNTTDPFSLEIWANAKRVDQTQALIGRNQEYLVRLESNNKYVFFPEDGANWANSETNETIISIDEIHSIITRHSGSEKDIIVDGGQTTAHADTRTATATSNQTRVGTEPWGGGGSDNLQALLWGIRIYSIGLTQHNARRRHEQPWYDYCRGS